MSASFLRPLHTGSIFCRFAKRPLLQVRAVLHVVLVAVGIIYMLSLAYPHRERALRGENDFVQLYTGAKLIGTPDLYSRAANLALIQATLGFTMETVVYTRPPFYAALLKPLALLPYRVAYAVFSLTTLASVLWFVVRFSRECSLLPVLAAWSVPVLTAVSVGQDTPFLLPILGVAILLIRQGKKDFLAGLLLSLVAIKFHLFLFVPILLFLKKRWRILSGAVTGLLALTAFGGFVGGANSILQYLNVLRDPSINPTATIMPNLHGLVAVLHGSMTLEFVSVSLVLVAFVWMVRRTENFEFLFAASLVCGLLVSFHSGVFDDIILLPVFVSVLSTCSHSSSRAAAAFILTPIPYLMVLADAPYGAVMPLALLMLLGLFCAAADRGRSESVVVALL
jgi:hypothetical protein